MVIILHLSITCIFRKTQEIFKSVPQKIRHYWEYLGSIWLSFVKRRLHYFREKTPIDFRAKLSACLLVRMLSTFSHATKWTSLNAAYIYDIFLLSLWCYQHHLSSIWWLIHCCVVIKFGGPTHTASLITFVLNLDLLFQTNWLSFVKKEISILMWETSEVMDYNPSGIVRFCVSNIEAKIFPQYHIV